MAKHLASYITDRTAIASHLSREFGVQYTLRDVERILSGIVEVKPIDTRKVGEPISFSPPIRTGKKGQDPLAIATNAYIARNAAKIREALGNAA
jgi:hypothetical protein